MRISDWSSDVCSSDLIGTDAGGLAGRDDDAGKRAHCMIIAPLPGSGLLQQFGRFGIRRNAIFDIRLVAQAAQRSEEHTSELQSLMRISYAVFCLKKKKPKIHTLRPMRITL